VPTSMPPIGVGEGAFFGTLYNPIQERKCRDQIIADGKKRFSLPPSLNRSDPKPGGIPSRT
jgi:hypothetical protein